MFVEIKTEKLMSMVADNRVVGGGLRFSFFDFYFYFINQD